MLKMNVGKAIKKHRQLSGLTQVELAELLNVSNKTISSWESNRTEPRMGDIEHMCRIFDCHKSDLIDLEPVKEDSIDLSGLSKRQIEILKSYASFLRNAGD